MVVVVVAVRAMAAVVMEAVVMVVAEAVRATAAVEMEAVVVMVVVVEVEGMGLIVYKLHMKIRHNILASSHIELY